MKPRYDHDCNECVFLGRHKEYDLYYCDSTPTIIARDGNDGPEYMSGLIFAYSNPVMKEAKRRAIKKGLLKKNRHFPGKMKKGTILTILEKDKVRQIIIKE